MVRGYLKTNTGPLFIFILIIFSYIFLICDSSAIRTRKSRLRSTLAKEAGGRVCKKEECKDVARRILKNMNTTVDPCENFYQYACGGWIKDNPIPQGKDELSAIVQLSDRNDKLLKRLLKEKSEKDSETIMKVKNFYKSCLNTELINKLGNKPLKKFIKDLGSWPAYHDWDEENWDFNQTLTRFHSEYPCEIFFTVDVDVDPKNRTRNIITIDQAKLSLPQIVYFVNKKALDTFLNYSTKIVEYAGGEGGHEEVKKKMIDVCEFEVKLSKIEVPKPAKRYARTTVGKLSYAVPEVKSVPY